jgi:signal transduction histidine kinase
MSAGILIAEDERIVARHIGEVVRRAGHRVSAQVGTGEAAVAKAAELRPDLVLMDVALGGEMDGVEAAARIREQAGTPVIYVTAYADDAMLERVKRTEPAGFLLKPFDDRELRVMVEVTLHRTRAARLRAGAPPPAADTRELARQRDQLRQAYAATLDAREQEARRIARALHDQAGQLLASLHFALDEVSAHVEEGARDRIPQIRAMVDEVQHELRRISHEMRPPVLDDLGLVPALDFMARGLARRSGLHITVRGPRRRLPPDREINLYRVAQEALNNVVRHAQAQRVVVEVSVRDGDATVEVHDDGRGFALEDVLARRGERGLGLLGMQERVDALGGQLSIESSPGAGTRVRVTVPIGPCQA